MGISRGPARRTLLCDNDFCIVRSTVSPLEKPELYLAVWNNGHRDICDGCQLQGDCHELFANGQDCPIHPDGKRWVQITEKQQKLLAKLLR